MKTQLGRWIEGLPFLWPKPDNPRSKVVFLSSYIVNIRGNFFPNIAPRDTPRRSVSDAPLTDALDPNE